MKLSALWKIASGFALAFSVSNVASAQTLSPQPDLNGLWTGQRTGNQVRLEVRSDGIAVYMAKDNAGAGNSGIVYRDMGGGSYQHQFPSGEVAAMQFLASGQLKVTNPDGWTDVFSRDNVASAQTLTPEPVAPRPATVERNGLWTGQRTGNQVRLEVRSDGIAVYMAKDNAGAGNSGIVYRDMGGGSYQHQFPSGEVAAMQFLASGQLKVTNPDGWTDMFSRDGRSDPQPAPVPPPVPIARVFTDAAAAAADVTAQPGGFDKFADDALAGRSSADIARDEAATQVLWAGERAILKQYPVTQCPGSEDRAAFAQCLRVRNETIFWRAEAERALLDRERPNMTGALYESFKVKFRIEMGENLARDSCAKLASSTAPCNLSSSSTSGGAPKERESKPAPHLSEDQKILAEMLHPSSSSTSGAAPKERESKPAPHLSEDQKVLAEMLRQSKEAHDTYRQHQLAHIAAEAKRSDALTVETFVDDRQVSFRITNNTDIRLEFSIDFKLILDGKEESHVPVAFVVWPREPITMPVYYLREPHVWSIQAIKSRWWAHSSNYEGSWNQPMQGS